MNVSEKFRKLTNKQDKEKMKKDEDEKWQLFIGKQKCFNFSGENKFHTNLPHTAKPIDYFEQYVNDDLITIMVTETNRNAEQVISKIRMNRSSRLHDWRPTSPEEIKKFIGILLWMGLHPLPRISDYWTKKIIYKNQVASKVMSRNRFQLLLRFWHFNNNENMEVEGRIAKLSPLISHLNNVFKSKKSSGEVIVIDESMIPFRGRLLFRQYLPAKTHKYGVKIFKICDSTGYTYKLKIYMGKGTGTDDNMSLASSVVMELAHDFLDKGHTLYVDNFYTSLDLANTLLRHSTHLVGTLTSNRAWFPHKKTIPADGGKKLNVGEMNCLEYPNGIVYTRWMDKREVRMLSTKHPVDFVDTGKKTRKGKAILKPLAVVEYNKAKMGIDISDQMASYSTAVRKSMRWYHKVAEEFVLGTAVVNAWLAYKDNLYSNNVRRRTHLHSITSFREALVYDLLGLQENVIEPVKATAQHFLAESNVFTGEGKNKRRVRKTCKICYDRVVRTEGRKKAKNLGKITTFCDVCPEKPYLCKDCFVNTHKK